MAPSEQSSFSRGFRRSRHHRISTSSVGFLDRGFIHLRETAGANCRSTSTTPIGCSLFRATILSPSFLQAELISGWLPRSSSSKSPIPMSKQEFNPDYAVPPGETLLETIHVLDLTQKELALRMGRPVKTINEIIKGVAAITPETSLQLEKVTGVPASFWNNAEANYRERLARSQERLRIETQIEWLKRFSYSKMVELQLVPASVDKTERVENLLRFFGVVSETQWRSTYAGLTGAAREATRLKSEMGDLSAWLRAGELDARESVCENYDLLRFKDALSEIRILTQRSPPDVWAEVCRLCAEAGVVVVLVPELPKTHVYGFTRWLTKDKALMQLSLRYKTDDVLWFTFFHEAAHLLLHGKKDVFLESRGSSDSKEKAADRWAANFLISERAWGGFVETLSQRVSEKVVRDFANAQQIAPGIVVGRLQKEGRLRHSFLNKLKHRLEIDWPYGG